MNAVATVNETAIVAQAPVSLMDALIRAASDPNVDVDKLERLGAIVRDINNQQAEHDFDEAMNAAQEEMRPIATDANNPSTHSKYASYGALDRVLRPIYTKHGFSLSFYTGEGAPADHVRVACRVARAGHKEHPHIDMPCDGKGAKGGDVMTKTHATGAAVTYGRRYLLGMIFNIAVGEDRDGNAPRGPMQPISDQQVQSLTRLMDDAGADRERFLNHLRIDTLAHLPAARFQEACNLLAQRKAAAAKKAAQ